MKTNLKTFPKWTSPCNNCEEGIEFEKWKEAFEKELREELAILDMRYCQTPDILSEKRRIKEVLGE